MSEIFFYFVACLEGTFYEFVGQHVAVGTSTQTG